MPDSQAGDTPTEPVVKATTAITTSQKTASMKIGDTKAITVTADPTDATDFDVTKVTSASSDDKIATVSADGTITAVAVGSATITYTFNAFTATVVVTVTAAE